MLIRLKEGQLPSIRIMHQTAMKFIFDKDHTTAAEMAALEEGIGMWSKIVDLNASDKWELKRIVNALIANDKGYFNRSKLLQIEHKVSYKTMYKAGLPFVDVDNRKFFNKS